MFCIPDPEGWDRKDQDSFKRSLVKVLKLQPNFLNKKAKRRRTLATKWAMIGNYFDIKYAPISFWLEFYFLCDLKTPCKISRPSDNPFWVGRNRKVVLWL